jgi:hypothetical protein
MGWILGSLILGALLYVLSHSDNDNDDNDDDFEEGCRVAFIHLTMDYYL